MSPGGIVLFEHEIMAGFFEKDFDQMRALPVVINDQDTSLFFHQRPGDRIDLRLIEPIDVRLRWILSDDVRSVDVKSARALDHLDHTRYFRVDSVSHRPERNSMSVDFLSRNCQVHYRRSVVHSACFGALARCKESSEHV